MEHTFPRGHVINLQKKEVQITALVTVLAMVCDCGSLTPILIPNHNQAGVCRVCKQKYVISEIVLKNQGGLVQMDMQVAKWAGPTSASPATEVKPPVHGDDIPNAMDGIDKKN